MATCLAVITLALRKSGAIGPYEPAEGYEAAAGLIALQGWYETWANSQPLTDRLVSTDVTAREYERISSTENITVSTPILIDDAEAEGGQRSPLDGAVIIAALGDPYDIYIYSARAADWVRITELSLTDEAPLTQSGAEGLACCLAENLASEPGREITPMAARAASHFRMRVNAIPQAIARKFY